MHRRGILKAVVLFMALLILPSLVYAGGKKGKVITTKSGLKYQDTKIGKGPEAKTGQSVTIFYYGSLTDGRRFDSNKYRNEPLTFRLGAGEVIKGWDEGIVGMKVGGIRKLVVPFYLGYGAVKAGSIIKPNDTLLFDIELLGIKQ